MNNKELIKGRIKEAILQSGQSQTELAKKISVSQSCIAHYIKGDIMPNLDTFADLCNVLDVDANYILGIEHKNNS